VWPLIYNICRHNNDIKRYRDKLRSLQNDHGQAKAELGNLNRRLKHKIIDLHSFFDISNNMFTIYDQRRLIESLIESLNTILASPKIVVMTRIKEGGFFKPLADSGRMVEGVQSLELTTDSKIFDLLASQNRALALPMLSSGLPEKDPFLEKALGLGLSQMEKLHTSGEIFGIVLIGEKSGGRPFDQAEIEIFTTLANLASLALGNIHQYMLIEKMSYTDFVTELYNYRYFYKRLKEEIFRAKRFDRMLALVIFDIDNFKLFNDTYGHQAGDEVLKNLSKLVTRSVRAIDVVSRYGGEEFCIIMPDTGFANCLIK
jgi:GGDEF domain-containing protein